MSRRSRHSAFNASSRRACRFFASHTWMPGRSATTLSLRHCMRLVLGAMSVLAAAPGHAELPVASSTWVSSGSATRATTPTTMTINQASNKAILNWNSFNISAGSSVVFKQPSSTAVAINKIAQADPSRINGSLTANGQIYLLNTSGIIFGRGAQVNVGTLLASSMNLTESALNKGLAQVFSEDKAAVAEAVLDGSGRVLSGNVIVEQGASVVANSGGKVMLFAPNVINQGSIQTSKGQALLAAGTKVYLLIKATDSDLRGFYVAVDVAEGAQDANGNVVGTVTNDLTGNIQATSGNITLAGLAVNQLGRVRATTAVQANGAVYLRAQSHVNPTRLASGELVPTTGGTLVLGEHSVTEAVPDVTDTATDVGENEQRQSLIDLQGGQVTLANGAHVTANGGVVNIRAQSDLSLGASNLVSKAPDQSRILIESGATIDVSGSTVNLAADSQTVTLQLFSEQLKDSPMQRDGILKGKTVTVDLRETGTRADGSTWVGTPVADVSGAVAGIKRTVAERSVAGGTINMISQGDVIVADGATLNISGGQKNYAAGNIATTKLTADGQLYDIADADPDRIYTGIAGQVTRKSDKWGVTRTFVSPVMQSTYSEADSQGADAGTLAINSARVILDGNVLANTTHGRFQQQTSSTTPKGGQLLLNTTRVVPGVAANNITIGVGSVLAGLKQNGFNPVTDAWPTTLNETLIRASLFGDNHITRASLTTGGYIATLNSSGKITVADGADVSLGTNGSLIMNGNAVEIAGDITSAGGTISASGVNVVLQSGASIDVSGEWRNDNPLLGAPASRAFKIDGGSVTLASTGGAVVVNEGAAIDVSGSGWVKTNGSLVAGKGGSIALNAVGGHVDLNGELSAYGLNQGGSLSVTTDAVCIASVACNLPNAQGDTHMLWLTPDFFQRNGFASYAFTANRGDVVVAANAGEVNVRQHNLKLNANYAAQHSGSDMETFSTAVTLPDALRKPTSLSLTTEALSNAELRVEQGARITADPASTLNLASRSRMLVDGELLTHGGTVNLVLNAPTTTDVGFDASQALWLGRHAVIDVSGTTVPTLNTLGLETGNVLAGGKVNITANRGYLIAEQGSQMDVSGSSDTLSVKRLDGVYEARTLHSDAGSISLAAAEGMVLEGSMAGHAGGVNALGGTLTVTMDAKPRSEPDASIFSNYPHAARVIDIVAGGGVSKLGSTTYTSLDASFTAEHNGVATLSTRMLNEGGFDALSLTARSLKNSNSLTNVAQPVLNAGTVKFSTDLQLARRIAIDASLIEVSADAVHIAAPYVSMGSNNNDINAQQFVPTLTSADHSLTIAADWLDVLGNSYITQANQVALTAQHDLRLRSVSQLDSTLRQMQGSLTTLGELNLTAAQIYPATLNDFSINTRDVVQSGSTHYGQINVQQSGHTAGLLYSAGGSLTLNASNIHQGGTLRAPFGKITLNATGTGTGQGAVTLASGSVTSTSAEGAIIPFGVTQGGINWAYALSTSQKLVFGDALDALPEQRVQINGKDVALNQGATVDISAGGDLQAYEWVKGVGGSVDTLSNATSPNSYAIVPLLGETIAPWDQMASASFTTPVGKTVHLDGGNGLAAGEYALLPARYALLPGAYLITEQAAYQDLSQGAQYQLLNGTTVIAGRYGVAGTNQQEDRTRGFAIVSSEFLRDPNNAHRPAQYDLTLASKFFTRQAVADGTVAPRLGMDAGVLALSATRSLVLEGTLEGKAEKGRGAAVDIAAGDLLVVAAGSSNSGTGNALAITDKALNDLGAESLSLGATRSTGSNGVNLDVVSNTVTLAEGVDLHAPELLLAATDTLSVQAGATLSGTVATGSKTPQRETYVLNGDSAVVRVSAGEQANLVRTASTGTRGALNVAEGATLAADGSIFIDAASDVNFAGNIQLDQGDLAIGANAINLGVVPTGTSGFNLDSAQLAALSENVDSLLLRSRSSINLYDAPALKANEVILDTSALIARAGEAGSLARIDADRVLFTNSATTVSSSTVSATHGSLQVTADDVVLGAGSYAITGFDAVNINASNTILGKGSGTLTVDATGDNAATHSQLNLTAGLMGGQTGATTKVVTDGRFALASNGNTPDETNVGLGASLTVQADAVNVTGDIKQQAGLVNLQASGAEGVTLGSGASIDVSGFKRQFDTAKAFAHAGAVKLSAAQGDVTMAQDASINVSGYVDTDATGSNAGSISVQAAQGHADLAGSLSAVASADYVGGSLSVDARQINQLDTLNTRLNANGFDEVRALRIREGDVTLNSGIVARQIDVTVDGANNTGGALLINAGLDAHGNSGGSVRLAARQDITLSNSGSIDVHATGIGKDGGSIDMTSTEGVIHLATGSAIHGAGGAANSKTAAGRDGSLHMTVNRDALAALANNPSASNMALQGTLDHLREVVVEGLKTYTPVNGVLTAQEVDAFGSEAWLDADSFMQDANVAAIKTALGQSDNDNFHVRPGVEFNSTGDLTLDSTFDLWNWHFGSDNESGYLSLRAGGDININQDLTDGISADYLLFNDQPSRSSWSYRLTAGADFTSASTHAVSSDVNAGDLVLASGGFGNAQRVIRTGDGDIDLHAAGDIKLMDDTSVIYTMGRAADLQSGMKQFFNDFGIYGIAFGERGGNITLNAGRDILGQPTDQLTSVWLWRLGSEAGSDLPAPTAWGVNYNEFRQGIGAFAGGNVSVHAGRDIDNVSAAVATVGLPTGQDQYDNQLVVGGGGDLNFRAGRDIGGGVYYVGRGAGTLAADGSIRAGTNWVGFGRPLHTTLALGDGQFNLYARGDAAIETVFNPTLLNPGSAEYNSGLLSEWIGDFSTYSDQSAVHLSSVSGDALFNADPIALMDSVKMSLVSPARLEALSLLPATLTATALSGDVVSGSGGDTSLVLAPAPGGTLELLAQNNVIFNELKYALSDTDPAVLPSVSKPLFGFSTPQQQGSLDISQLFNIKNRYTHAAIPVHSAEYAALVGYAGQQTPVRLIANTGDIDMSGNTVSTPYALWSSKPVRMVAGGDIIDPSVTIQHTAASELSQISAGGAIRYPLAYDTDRRVAVSSKQINLDGPGELLVTAGGGINLNTSIGIATRGNLYNAALPDAGANITVLAGQGAQPPAYDEFIAKYLDDISTYQSLLNDYMVRHGVETTNALQQFKELSRAEQLPLLVKVLAAELRTVGRDAANGKGNYDKAYAALKTLLPNVDPAKLNEGDLNLYFSRIYTQKGGDLNLLVPAGMVNVGLASPPDSFGVTRSPAQLGIVAQSAGSVNIMSGLDTLVNQSRVFAADGGDIMIWSTIGDIDAGRGAKTAISAPPPVVTVDSAGNVTVNTLGALTGSGIRAFVTTEGREPGNVDLFAPSGVIFVNEAGIGTAGNLTLGATRVVGAENIDVGGTAVGVPVDAGGLGAALSSVSASSTGASNTAEGDGAASGETKDKAPIAQTALSWLEVFVVGLGEDNCKQDDLECLKRQSTQ